MRKVEESDEVFDRTKNLAIEMKNALPFGDIDELGILLGEAWEAKKKFSLKISNPVIDKMYETARQEEALGWKIRKQVAVATYFCSVNTNESRR